MCGCVCRDGHVCVGACARAVHICTCVPGMFMRVHPCGCQGCAIHALHMSPHPSGAVWGHPIPPAVPADLWAGNVSLGLWSTILAAHGSRMAPGQGGAHSCPTSPLWRLWVEVQGREPRAGRGAPTRVAIVM